MPCKNFPSLLICYVVSFVTVFKVVRQALSTVFTPTNHLHFITKLGKWMSKHEI